MIDVDKLLKEAPEAPPCGPDLASDAAYLALRDAARGRAGPTLGNTSAAAEGPAWPQVAQQAQALLVRSKDLRIGVIALQAAWHLEGPAGLCAGLDLLRGFIEQWWDTVHPQLDPDDGFDPIMRVNALGPLAQPRDGPPPLLQELRDRPLLQSPQHGVLRLRDVEIVAGRLAPRAGSTAMPPAQLEALVAHAAGTDLPARAAQALASWKALDAALRQRIDPTQAPDLRGIRASLEVLAKAMPLREALAPALAEEGVVVETASTQAAASTDKGMARADIRCREDAMAAIDRIIAYLEQTEPTSPAPLLLRRARRFMGMGFQDLVKELSPDSLAKVQSVTGSADGQA